MSDAVTEQVRCNICDGENFRDFKSRKLAQCATCFSMERTRLLWMYLQDLPVSAETRVLHLAPEKGLYMALQRKLDGAQYDVADLSPERYAFAENVRKIDLCELEDEPSDSYDVIIHSHVLEHVPCNIAYTLFHLTRMLKPTGKQICIIPITKGYYDESYVDVGPEERTRRFGQHDHVRRFGVEDLSSHLGKIIRLPAVYDAEARFGADRLAQAGVPKPAWQGFSINTVLEIGKNDYLL